MSWARCAVWSSVLLYLLQPACCGEDTPRVQVPLQALVDNALRGLANAACRADGEVGQCVGLEGG